MSKRLGVKKLSRLSVLCGKPVVRAIVLNGGHGGWVLASFLNDGQAYVNRATGELEEIVPQRKPDGRIVNDHFMDCMRYLTAEGITRPIAWSFQIQGEGGRGERGNSWDIYSARRLQL